MNIRTAISLALAASVAVLSCKDPVMEDDGKQVEIQGEYTIKSPDANVVSKITISDRITYDLTIGGTKVLEDSPIGLGIGRGLLYGNNPVLSEATTSSVDEVIKAVNYSKSQVSDCYNRLLLDFGPDFDVEFRAYDEGLAYRFIINKDEEYSFVSERAEFNFAQDYSVIAAAAPLTNEALDPWQSSFEGQYFPNTISTLEAGVLYQSPLLVDCGGRKVVIAESDVLDYPGMFLTRREGKETQLVGEFAKYPDSMVPRPGHPTHYNMTYSAYTSKHKGERTFPWRILCVGDTDAELLTNDMVYRLATPSKIGDASWVKPGLAVWDYWNGWNGKGNGNAMTYDDYKVFVDMAADNGIEYYLIDGGWNHGSITDLAARSSVRLGELAAYAASRNVGLILWVGANQFCAYDMERVCRDFSALGIKGFKVDYWEHDNQKMMKLMEDATAMAAKYNLLIDFHGCTKPSGFNRTYPNAITFEGVRGMEYSMIYPKNYYAMVENNLTFPFIRQLSGPVDLTPGSMDNKKLGTAQKGVPDSEGTRAHNMALFITTYSPLACLCDSPTRYNESAENKECLAFMGRYPTVWDETVVLDASLGNRVIIARRHGSDWYVAGINGSAPMEVTVPLYFLDGSTWYMDLIKDAADSDENPQHFVSESSEVNSTSSIKVRMAAGGGFTAIISREKYVAGTPTGPSVPEEPEIYEPTNLQMSLPDASKANGMAVLTCPGGGYNSHSMTYEGTVWNEYLNNLGIANFVLKYALPKGNPQTTISDVENAMRYIRAHADEYGIDPEKVGIMGFSAGGHIASTIATHSAGNARPSFQILFYPVITMNPSGTHTVTMQNFLGSSPSQDMINLYSNEKQVTSSTPQCFLTYTQNDKLVPYATNGKAYRDALVAAGVPVTLKAYESTSWPENGHGWAGYDKFPYKFDVESALASWLKSL